MANYLIDHLKRGAHVAIDEYPLLLAIRIREAIVVNRLKQAGDHVAIHQSDFANLVNDTQSATQAQVAADPNLSAIVGETDTEMPVIDQVLKQHGLCHQILNLNLYDDPQNLQIIRSGCLAADVTEPPGVYGFFAVDQLAQMFARHLPESSLAKSIQVLEKKWGIDLVGGPSTVTVTKANVPPPGKFVAPTYNYVKFFTTAWHSEFRGVAIQSSIQN